MSTYKTPGVYVEEVSTIPSSIVQFSTAIPIFLGYTKKNNSNGEAVRITSLNEYVEIFGGSEEYDLNPFTYNQNTDTYSTTMPATIKKFFYEAIQLYFLNGGGPCYIISIGHHSDTLALEDFIGNANSNIKNPIEEIEKLDEVTLISFPEAVGLTISDYNLVAGAAISVCENTKEKFVLLDVIDDDINSFRNTVSGSSYAAAYHPYLETSIKISYSETDTALGPQGSAEYNKKVNTFNNINKLTIPPSALIAGIYAKNDNDRGFWKAPANIALQGVIKPTKAISDAEQADLNIDATAGKSINCIRQFTGKGNLVWGARTMDGNSNEWRYVNVRRLFMTAEESIKKAIFPFVFDSNNEKTWVKVRFMIEAYLLELWKDGALVGNSPDQAFFVQVGSGTTMTQQDILNGRMIVEIGLAASRPAEFIVLKFSHKLQDV